MFFLLLFFCNAYSLEHNPDSLKNIIAKKIVQTANLYGPARRLNRDLQEFLAQKIIEQKVKKQLYPLMINTPQNPISINHRGVCGLEVIDETKQIISLGCDGKIAFGLEHSMDKCRMLNTHKNWFCASLHHPTKKLYIGGFDGSIGSINIETKIQSKPFQAHSQAVNALSFFGCEPRLISCSNDHLIKLWNLSDATCAAIFSGHTKAIKNAFTINAHQKILSGAADRSVRVWDIATQKEEQRYSADEAINISRVAKHVHEHVALCGYNSGSITILDIRDDSCVDIINAHQGIVSALACSTDGNYIASGSWDGTARIWDMRMMACAAVLSFHKDWIQHIAGLHNFQKLISGSRDGTVKIWDLEPIALLDAPSTLDQSLECYELVSQKNVMQDQERLALAQKIGQTIKKGSFRID